jgi:hypothetical protein
MFSRTRKLYRRRRFLSVLALGFAAVGVLAGTASANSGMSQSLYDQHMRNEARDASRQLEPMNGGLVSKSLIEQRDAQLAAGVRTPDYSHLPSEDRAQIFAPAPSIHTETVSASSSGSGFDRGDWMRGFALAAALISAAAFALIMVRGGVRTAHS